ncbi:MAG: DUF4369 domain-containing protein [Bacteroidota bacterium]|nr:DUF4369 domain-containing protein [Bacteroidota bacterium]MEE2723634.1 DUF4369 domain-containing protein [Bacteroidota bacterium]
MIKRISIYRSFVYLFILIGCKSNIQNKGLMMHVSGKIDGLRKGTLYLQKVLDSTLVDVDSLVINGNPEFQFKTEIESPEIFYLYLNKEDGDSLNDRIMFFAEKGEITINTLLNTFESSAKVSGSKNQNLLQQYKKISRQFNAKNLEYIKAYIESSQSGNNPRILDSIQKAMDNLLKRRYLYALNFASTNGDNVISPYIALTEVSDANIKLLDTVVSKLSDKVKSSKYGKLLIDFISERRALESND